jgi:hypothetical protein
VDPGGCRPSVDCTAILDFNTDGYRIMSINAARWNYFKAPPDFEVKQTNIGGCRAVLATYMIACMVNTQLKASLAVILRL